jgi:hypothetical protein
MERGLEAKRTTKGIKFKLKPQAKSNLSPSQSPRACRNKSDTHIAFEQCFEEHVAINQTPIYIAFGQCFE